MNMVTIVIWLNNTPAARTSELFKPCKDSESVVF